MHTLNMNVLHSVHGGQSKTILTAGETCTGYFISVIASNAVMLAVGVSPFHTFPISLAVSFIPVYLYGESKKNPA